MARPIRCGVVGFGFIGPHHVEAMRRLPNVEVFAVASRRPDHIRDQVRRLGIPKLFGSYHELVACPEIDLVDVATPTESHHPIALAAIAAGKHVIVDKPLALNVAQAKQMVAAAKHANVVNAVAFNYRYFPLVQQARIMIKRGELGALHLLRGHYLQEWLLHDDDFSWRLDPEQSGEGAMIADAGSHWFDLIEHVSGLQIESVIADIKTVIKVRQKPTHPTQPFQSTSAARQPYQVQVPDLCAALLRFSTGALGSFTTSPLCAGHENDLAFEMHGSSASLSWQQQQPNVLLIGKRDEPNQILTKDPALLHAEARKYAALPGGHNEAWPDAFKNLLANIFNFVESGDPVADEACCDFPSFASGLRTMRIVDALLISAKTGQWTSVGQEA